MFRAHKAPNHRLVNFKRLCMMCLCMPFLLKNELKIKILSSSQLVTILFSNFKVNSKLMIKYDTLPRCVFFYYSEAPL